MNALCAAQLTGPEALKELVRRSLELMPLGDDADEDDLEAHNEELEAIAQLAQAVQLEILDKEKI